MNLDASVTVAEPVCLTRSEFIVIYWVRRIDASSPNAGKRAAGYYFHARKLNHSGTAFISSHHLTTVVAIYEGSQECLR